MAKDSSHLSDYTKKNIHIGAVIVYKNKVIASGWNTNKTNPLQLHYNQYRDGQGDRHFDVDKHLPSLHAEMKCLVDTKDLDIDWSKASMFVYRESGGKTRNCCPCPSCTQALKDRGILNVYYTNEDGYVYKRLEEEDKEQ